MDKVAVIINPISGAGRRADLARRRAEHAAALMHARGLAAEIFVTERQGHALELTQAALRHGAQVVVAWGGDGTVNEVASALVHTPASLAIVPAGSGNGLARELGIPMDPAGALRVALDGATRLIDAGELDGHPFFNIAGIGLDARVAHRFAQSGLARRGFLRYLELAAVEVPRYTPVECMIATDGTQRRARALVIALANGRQYGNGALIAPRALVDDGQLDVVVVDHRSWLAVLVQLPRLFTGRLEDVPRVTMTHATSVEICSTTRLEYHVDGEPHTGGVSVKARIHPGALRVLS